MKEAKEIISRIKNEVDSAVALLARWPDGKASLYPMEQSYIVFSKPARLFLIRKDGEIGKRIR